MQNRGQGLGFVMGGMVVDRKTLVRVTATLLTGTFSAITYIYGIMDQDVMSGGLDALSDGTSKLPTSSEGSWLGELAGG